MRKRKTKRRPLKNAFFAEPPKTSVIAAEKEKGGKVKSPLPGQTQMIKRPVTAMKKRQRRQSFADGVKSLLKAIKKMM